MTVADPFAHLAGLPGVAEAVDRARAAVDGLRGHRVLRRSAERVASESALRGARASAALAGTDVPLEDLRRSLAAPVDPVLRGALRVGAETGTLRSAWAASPLQVLARLHTLAAAGQVPDGDLGRPAPEAVARLSGLAGLLTGATHAPALVVAAVVHAEVVPAFAVGGGLVGRAAARLTSIGRGLDPGGVSVPEVGHVELGATAYADALAGYRDEGPGGLARWVVHCAEATVLGAREGVAVCEAIQRGA